MISTLLTGKIAAALACAAVGITGAAGAAFAGVNIAHDTIGATQAHHGSAQSAASHSPEATESPEASESESPEATESPEASESESPEASESPKATLSAHVSATPTASPSSNAAFGLCQAWSNAVKHHLEGQVGFRDKLAGLAGGAANITTFCASVKHPDGHESPSVSPSGSVTPSASTSSDEDGPGNGKGEDERESHSKSSVSPLPSVAPQTS